MESAAEVSRKRTRANASSVDEALGAGPIPEPGTPNPDNPKELWTLCTSGPSCPWFPVGRWRQTTTPLKLKAVGFKERCLGCAQRARRQRHDEENWNLKTGDENGKIDLPSGSREYPLRRSPEEIKNKISVYECGICDEEHRQSSSHGDDQAAFCGKCIPWAKLALKPRQYAESSAERDAIYYKINRIRVAFRDDALLAPDGVRTPFWTLAKMWAEWYQRVNKTSSWGVYLAHYRHAVLYFMDKPIGEIGDEDVKRFEEILLTQRGRRGTRMNTTVLKTIETLRRIFKYAQMMEWIEKIPTRGEITRTQRRAGKKQRSKGRPARAPETDKQKLTEDLDRIRGQLILLKRQGFLLVDVTSNQVAELLSIGSKERGGTVMMQRLSSRGLKRGWPSLKEFFWNDGQVAELISEVSFYYSQDKN